MRTAFPPVPHVAGIAAPLLKDNVDTDVIIPSREIRGVGKSGLADGMFAAWRYLPGGRIPDPAFVLNDPAFAGAPILLAGENLGCGSSREHAVWALHEYGIRAIVAASFAPIFRSNCVANGIVPAVLPRATIEAIAASRAPVAIDLGAMTVSAGAIHAGFTLEEEARARLAEGLDAIDLTLRRRDAIAAFHAADRARRPWIYLAATA